MANDNRDGHGTEHGEGVSAKQSNRRTDRKADQKNPEDENESERKKDEPKKFQFSKKSFVIGGIVLGLILIIVLLYWLHARNFQSTDDAYTTTHVHEISARVAGTVESVTVNDNQFVKEGQTLVVLDQRDFKVAAEQARAQVLQRRASADQAQANQTHA